MSVEIYRPNGPGTEPSYPIGTTSIEYPGFIDFLLPSLTVSYEKKIANVVVPTYGLWAGPGWSGGTRSSDADWTVAPCMNESVKTSPTPETCFSLLDAICKTHDWNYSQAEKLYPNDELAYEAAIMAADIQLLLDVQTAYTGTYISPTGTYNKSDGT